MTTHGGARPGAGKKKGTKNRKSATDRAIAREASYALKRKGWDLANAIHDKETPLQVMVEVMLEFRDRARDMQKRAKKDGDVVEIEDGEGGKPDVYTPSRCLMIAADIASKAAPFVHAKLASVEANVTGKVSLYEESLRALEAEPDAT